MRVEEFSTLTRKAEGEALKKAKYYIFLLQYYIFLLLS